MAAGQDRRSRCGRLTDHPKFDKWKEEMAPGEMWSLCGEKWLVNTSARYNENEPALGETGSCCRSGFPA